MSWSVPSISRTWSALRNWWTAFGRPTPRRFVCKPGRVTETPAQVVSRAVNGTHGLQTKTFDLSWGSFPITWAPGPGPRWLMIPGLLHPSTTWGAVLRTQVGHAETWAPSLRGLGPDDDGADAITLSGQISAMEEILVALGNTPVVLVGHGLGGAIASHVARRHPHLVSHLVVIGFGVLDDPAGWWESQRLLTKDPDAYLDAALHAPTLSPALYAKMERVLRSTAYQRFLTAPEVADLGNAFDELTVPTLFVGGESDDIVPRWALETAVEQVPNSRLEWVARASHLVHMERSQELLSVVRSFVASTSPIAPV